jgi:hypothetical protein
MKQTAVEWLEFRYKNNITLNQYDFEQAKEMEKEQQGYSEEEVKFIISEALQSALVNTNLELWFNIFKKK